MNKENKVNALLVTLTIIVGFLALMIAVVMIVMYERSLPKDEPARPEVLQEMKEPEKTGPATLDDLFKKVTPP